MENNEKIQQKSSLNQSYKLIPISDLAKPVGFLENYLKQFRNLPKPISPMSSPIHSPFPENPELKISRYCQYHVLIKPDKPCIDCFILDYYKDDLFTDPEIARAAIELKKSLS